MNVKHTPGPWGFDLYPDGAFEIEKKPNDLGKYMVLASRNAHPEREDEMHANARLIAAAPELLGALERLHAYVAKHGPESMFDALDASSRAIAKAKGEA